MRLVTIIFSTLLFLAAVAQAQDAQFSQFYNAPLYLNPAMAGTGQNARVGLNYRNQWAGLGTAWQTTSVWGDHQILPAKSGVGILLLQDRAGASQLQQTQLELNYAYEAALDDRWVFRPGIGLGYTWRNVNYGRVLFGDQLNADGNNGQATTDPLVASADGTSFFDVSAGMMVYNERFYGGLSLHHLNRPNQGFSGISGIDPLPLKFGLQLGYQIPLHNTRARGENLVEQWFSPVLHFKQQGTASQLDLGFYYLHGPLLTGLSYRGLLVKPQPGGSLHSDALITMIGMEVKGFTLAYSYDITLSGLGLSRTGGAHEIALIYEWEIRYPKYREKRVIPCPKFHKRYQ